MQISRGPAGELQVAGEAEIGEIDELRRGLLERLAQERQTVVDLSGVESCDAALVQLLVSLGKTAAGSGKEVTVQGASGAVREAFAMLGIHLEAAGSAALKQEERERSAQ